MNKFSPASAFQSPPESQPAANANDPSDPNSSSSNKSQVEEPNDTDFDFGDLVTMTIIDVFETDNDGKLLSYCPTFDNRAVHKTQESIERLRKGASQLREIARSPAGVKVNKVNLSANFFPISFVECGTLLFRSEINALIPASFPKT